MKRPRWTPRVAALAVLIPLLAACGGTAPPASSQSPPTASAAARSAGAAAAGAPAPGKSAEWDQLVASAKKEGKLSLTVPPGPQYQPALREAFSKAFPGIELEMVNLLGGQFRVRLAKERTAGEFAWDACICGPGADTYQLAKEGVFDPIREEIILPELLEDGKWLAGFNGRYSDDGKKYVFDFGATNNQSSFVNRDLIPELALNTYDDLWKPEFKGKIVWQDPRGPGSGVNQALLILLTKGERALRELWTNQQVLTSTDDRQMAEWMARGVRPIGIGIVANRGVDLLKKEGIGLNVKPFPAPKPSSSPGPHAVILINRPPHPNARKLFLNWLLTPEGQKVVLEPVRNNSARLDVPPFDPDAVVPTGVETISGQAEAYAPMRIKAGQIAMDVFK